MLNKAIVLVALVACGGDDPPSCQQAMAHYYGAGCTFRNNQTNAPISEGEMRTFCQQALIDAPPQCEDDLAVWRTCLGGVKDPVMTDADCDCSVEFDALLGCE